MLLCQFKFIQEIMRYTKIVSELNSDEIGTWIGGNVKDLFTGPRKGIESREYLPSFI